MILQHANPACVRNIGLLAVGWFQLLLPLPGQLIQILQACQFVFYVCVMHLTMHSSGFKQRIRQSAQVASEQTAINAEAGKAESSFASGALTKA